MKHKALVSAAAIGLMALRFADVQAMPVSEEVLITQTTMLQQSEGDMLLFTAPGPGEVFVTLTDLNFPTAFTSLQYGLDDSAIGLSSSMINAGVLTTLALTGAGPTTIDADIFGRLGGSAGLYNFTASFLPASSVVPLPASAVSMLGGCVMVLLSAGRRRRRSAD